MEQLASVIGKLGKPARIAEVDLIDGAHAPDAAAETALGYADNLKMLRGQDQEPGGILDRAA